MLSYIKDKTTALKLARIGSLGAFGYAGILLWSLFKNINGRKSVDIDDIVLVGAMNLGLIIITIYLLLTLFWAWRIFKGRGFISCCLLLTLSAVDIAVLTKHSGKLSLGLIQLACFLLLFIFGLSGTWKFNRLKTEVDSDVFE